MSPNTRCGSFSPTNSARRRKRRFALSPFPVVLTSVLNAISTPLSVVAVLSKTESILVLSYIQTPDSLLLSARALHRTTGENESAPLRKIAPSGTLPPNSESSSPLKKSAPVGIFCGFSEKKKNGSFETGISPASFARNVISFACSSYFLVASAVFKFGVRQPCIKDVRPDPIKKRSATATLNPFSAARNAVVIPSKPPPITRISTFTFFFDGANRRR